MKAITLWQPWASWVDKNWKLIETRTHSRFASLVGQRIAIHAAMVWDKNAVREVSPFSSVKLEEAVFSAGPYGAVLCTAYVWKHDLLKESDSKDAMIDCGKVKRYGLFLNEVKSLKRLFPVRGKQGIWNVEIPKEFL
jgi:hypothetical protein